MSVEEARDRLDGAIVDRLSADRWDAAAEIPVDEAIDRLILEAQAAMPCYDDCLKNPERIGGAYVCDDDFRRPDEEMNPCPSCAARAELERKKVAAVLPQLIATARETHDQFATWEPEEPHRG